MEEDWEKRASITGSREIRPVGWFRQRCGGLETFVRSEQQKPRRGLGSFWSDILESEVRWSRYFTTVGRCEFRRFEQVIVVVVSQYWNSLGVQQCGGDATKYVAI